MGLPYDIKFDLNRDGVIDEKDFDILRAAYNSVPGEPNWNPLADFDGNGQVAGGDMSRLYAYYGAVAPEGTPGILPTVKANLPPEEKAQPIVAEMPSLTSRWWFWPAVIIGAVALLRK